MLFSLFGVIDISYLQLRQHAKRKRTFEIQSLRKFNDSDVEGQIQLVALELSDSD